MKALPIRRRLAIAVAACCIAALLFRGQVAVALVSRGDEFLTRGDVGAARRYYLRAARLDPNLSPAVDRFVFFGIEQRTRESLNDAASFASTYLLAHPDDGLIRADRALCYQILKRYRAAATDFQVAAVRLASPKYYTFAGWAQFRLGNHAAARRSWIAALRIEPAYSPAASALRRTVR